MSSKYILAHDLGTSSNKAVLVTMDGDIVGMAKEDYPIFHPEPTWAEQEPMDWWNAVCVSSKKILKKSKVSPKDVAGITFTTQTQCLVPMDKDGKPLRRAFSWLDSRSREIINKKLWTPPRLLGYNIPKLIKYLMITGGAPGHTGKDQIGKLLWFRENEPELFQNTYKYLDAKDFLIYQFTDNYVTSVDLAVVWWMLDTRKNRNQWHPKLCKLANITPEHLPEVKASAEIVGNITKNAAEETGLMEGTPIINGAGDLSAAALGSGAIQEGELHACIGTSGWVAGHYTKRKIDLLHYTGCIGSTYPEKFYLAMGHQETVGICLEWLKDKVIYQEDVLTQKAKVENIYQLLDQLVEDVLPCADGVMFAPWMHGERCPIDDEYIRGGLFNLGLRHGREHMIRAVYEGIAMNLKWALETMETLYWPVTKLHLVGGGAQSDTWCQIIADICDRQIICVKEPRMANARGVALLASFALGHIQKYEDITRYVPISRSFEPNPENVTIYQNWFKHFKKMYHQTKSWYREINRSV